MLSFPEALTEKRGLRLATALRNGAEAELREALARQQVEEPEAEWLVLEPILTASEKGGRIAGRGGRPKSRSTGVGWLDDKTIRTSAGIIIRRGRDGDAHVLRLEGRGLDSDLMDSLMAEIEQLLARP